MHHDAGVLESIADEVDALHEVSGHVEPIAILPRNLQVERNFRFGMAEIDALSSGQDGPDAMFYIP